MLSMITLRTNKGFTLVELAVSLVVIGLLIGLGMSLVGPLTVAVKVRETKESIDGTVESINSWASGNNHLPDLTNYNFNTIVKSPADSWGRNFVYLYDCLLASTNPSSPAATDTISCSGAASTFSKDTICGRRTTRINLITDQGATISNVAYVMFSLSDDATVHTKMTGTLNNPAAAVGVSNPAILNNALIPYSGFVTPTAPATTATITLDANNSDIVRWVTLDELRTKAGCQGAQLRIMTNELPYGYNNVAYSANIYTDGGVSFSSGGKYSWCIQTSMGDIATPTNITFKTTGGTSIPFKANCSSAVALQSDYLVIGGTPAIPAVNGTDSKVYSCSRGHVAAAANQPISGASYAQYWQLAAPGTIGATWVSGTAYYPASSNNITVYSYDSAGNSAYKSFVFTINP